MVKLGIDGREKVAKYFPVGEKEKSITAMGIFDINSSSKPFSPNFITVILNVTSYLIAKKVLVGSRIRKMRSARRILK